MIALTVFISVVVLVVVFAIDADGTPFGILFHTLKAPVPPNLSRIT
jgi:hypothetical protein